MRERRMVNAGAAVCARTSPEAAQAPAASPHSMRRRPCIRPWRVCVSMVAMLRLAHAPPPDATLTRSAALDFALLQQTLPGQTPRNRRALWWMLGFLVLVVASVVALVLYLSALKMRRKNADASPTASGWSKARASLQPPGRRLAGARAPGGAGVALRPPPDRPRPCGAVCSGMPRRHPLAWLAGARAAHGVPARWQADSQAHPANAEALSSMLDIAAGLRRSAYAGPMRQADGHADRHRLADGAVL